MSIIKTKSNIGLALGSGAARGLSHLGVIRALEEAGIKIDYVAGTSMGAIVGAVYASGKLDSFEKVYSDFDRKKIVSLFDVVLPRSGLIDGKKLANFVRDYIGAKEINDLLIPFRAVATDIDTGQEVIFQSGDIIEAVRASVSVPGIFTPLLWQGRTLVDGGLVNPVPVTTARQMGADFVIAVDINHDILSGKIERTNAKIANKALAKKKKVDKQKENVGGGKIRTATANLNKRMFSKDNRAVKQFQAWRNKESAPNIFNVLLSSFNIMESLITETRLRIDPPDLLIQPQIGHIHFMDFHRAEEIIKAGYDETWKQLDAYNQKHK